jgi:hypothetical protein
VQQSDIAERREIIEVAVVRLCARITPIDRQPRRRCECEQMEEFAAGHLNVIRDSWLAVRYG